MAFESPDHDLTVGTNRPRTAWTRTVLTSTLLVHGIETVSVIGSRQVPRPLDDGAGRALIG